MMSSQVQRERACVEGPAGSSQLTLQAERLSEEEPGKPAAAARQVTADTASTRAQR